MSETTLSNATSDLRTSFLLLSKCNQPHLQEDVQEYVGQEMGVHHQSVHPKD